MSENGQTAAVNGHDYHREPVIGCHHCELERDDPVTADLTPAQAARLEAIEAAPWAEEAAVERVARALCEADGDGLAWDDWPDHVHLVYRQYAVAAIDVMRGATDDGAVGRVLALHVRDRWGDECAGCRAECLYCEGEHPWPCPTVTAVGAPATAEGDDRG